MFQDKKKNLSLKPFAGIKERLIQKKRLVFVFVFLENLHNYNCLFLSTLLNFCQHNYQLTGPARI